MGLSFPTGVENFLIATCPYNPRAIHPPETLISTRTTFPLPLPLPSLIIYHVTFLNNVTRCETRLKISQIAVLYTKA